MNIEKELHKIIAAKDGNQELSVHYWPECGWCIMVGNTSRFVNLGEVDGEIESCGETLEEAIREMKTTMGI